MGEKEKLVGLKVSSCVLFPFVDTGETPIRVGGKIAKKASDLCSHLKCQFNTCLLKPGHLYVDITRKVISHPEGNMSTHLNDERI